ncbi:MAG: hypothetical protein ACP5RS_07440 [Thermoplasmata archaeon]
MTTKQLKSVSSRSKNMEKYKIVDPNSNKVYKENLSVYQVLLEYDPEIREKRDYDIYVVPMYAKWVKNEWKF